MEAVDPTVSRVAIFVGYFVVRSGTLPMLSLNGGDQCHYFSGHRRLSAAGSQAASP